MSHEFSVDFSWLSRDTGDLLDRATFAEIMIVVDSLIATEIEDYLAKTVRPTARVSAYLLAQWLATNWWRLRWEPERRSLSWRMSHKIGAAGGGYLWPDLSFSSDGGEVAIHSLTTPRMNGQPIRYLNSIDVAIPATEFEKGVDNFVEGVVARLTSEGIGDVDLVEVWKEVLEERYDPVLHTWRKLEAIMGFDPGEAPDTVIEKLQEEAAEYGSDAVNEMAAASADHAIDDIETLWNAVRGKSTNVRITEADRLRQLIGNEVQPAQSAWRKATEAAKLVRDAWSLGENRVATKDLCDLLEVPRTVVENPDTFSTPTAAGFRNGDSNRFQVALRSPRTTNRRFALVRLIGDFLSTDERERLLPVTPAKTQRQKYQRAFAQEFLCPFSELEKYLADTELSDEAIDDAAAYFDVSPLLVKTTLVNKGRLHRTLLTG